MTIFFSVPGVWLSYLSYLVDARALVLEAQSHESFLPNSGRALDQQFARVWNESCALEIHLGSESKDYGATGPSSHVREILNDRLDEHHR